MIRVSYVNLNIDSSLHRLNESQERQFHQGSQSNNWQTPHPENICSQKYSDDNVPCNKHNISIEEHRKLNSCDMISEKTSDNKLIEAVKNIDILQKEPTNIQSPTKTSTKELDFDQNCKMSDSEDSFVACNDEASENMDTESDSEDSSVASDDETHANTSILSDSDDSFIVFAGGENESSNFVEELTDDDSSSEDSFILFDNEAGPSHKSEMVDDTSSGEDDDDDEMELDLEMTRFFEAARYRKERLEQLALLEEQESVSGVVEEEKTKQDNGKKVTFAEESNLCVEHIFISYTSYRFRMEIERFGRRLDEFLQPKHRQKVYEERFKDRQE